MIELDQFTEFLGWTLVINVGVLMFATVTLAVGRPLILKIHKKILGLEETELLKLYANYLSNYKIAVSVFSLVPYAALKIMGH